MADFEAYDAHEPCKNPNCKSFGVPHPNCRCYGSFAGGGEVKSYCEGGQPHQKDCEYFADGGEVAPTHADPQHSVASYLGQEGLHGLITMAAKASDQSIPKYNQAVKRGGKAIDTKINNLFDGGKSENVDYTKPKKTVEDWLDRGGATDDMKEELYRQNAPQMFAHGGIAKASPSLDDPNIANTYPDQNVILQSAKGNASNYLTSLRPQKNVPKLAFDEEPDTTDQERRYQKALHIAVNPLHVLDKIKDGSIEPDHLTHFKSMYPGMDDALQKKITERITEAQLKGEKPKAHVRQSLSMFMGTALSSDLSPQYIQAAQATFQMQQQAGPQGQPAAKNKKGTSSLSKSDQSFLTSNQSRIERQQKQ